VLIVEAPSALAHVPEHLGGDADFYQPEVNPLSGAAYASDLAFAASRGPGIVCDLEGRRPLVEREHDPRGSCVSLTGLP